jgi:hypothetical protein
MNRCTGSHFGPSRQNFQICGQTCVSVKTGIILFQMVFIPEPRERREESPLGNESSSNTGTDKAELASEGREGARTAIAGGIGRLLCFLFYPWPNSGSCRMSLLSVFLPLIALISQFQMCSTVRYSTDCPT